MAHAFGAFRWVNFVNFFAQINRLIRALGLAHIAVDAFIGDHQCHGASSTQVSWNFMVTLSATGNTRKTCKAVAPAHLTNAPSGDSLK
jgi:hypothetical protein